MPTAPRSHPTLDPGASLAARYQAVRERISAAADRSSRRAEEIILVAVTKHASIDEIRAMIELGHVDFGENRVQHLMQRTAQIEEYLSRRRELGRADDRLPEHVRWHMIGHLQRNKVRKLVESVRLIHSVDSLRLAEELHISGARLDHPIEVLVQVNVAGEKNKSGVAPAAARHLVEQIDTMIHLKPRGLMVMAPLVDDPEAARPVFTRGRELFDDIVSSGAGGDRFNILSMGMTNDFEVAIECGSNMVRIGSAIFGDSSNETDGGGGAADE